MSRTKAEPVMDQNGNLLLVFDAKKDRMVPVRIAVLKHKVPKEVPVQIISDPLDPEDAYTPIRRAMIDGLYDWDPRSSCLKGDREGCTLYDQLVVISKRYMCATSHNDRERVRNPPEILFMRAQDQFCQHCLREQHSQRKHDNRAYRRFARWLLRRR